MAGISPRISLYFLIFTSLLLLPIHVFRRHFYIYYNMLKRYPEASAVEQKPGLYGSPRDTVMMYSSDGKVGKNYWSSSVL